MVCEYRNMDFRKVSYIEGPIGVMENPIDVVPAKEELGFVYEHDLELYFAVMWL